MSQHATPNQDTPTDTREICEFCGFPITGDRDECPSDYGGSCQP